MKPFNLEQAKAGKPVQTRDGRDVEIVRFNLRGDYPILAIIKLLEYDCAIRFSIDGSYNRKLKKNYNDLFMKSETKEGWVAVLAGGKSCSNIYDTKEEAEFYGEKYSTFVAVTKIEWEE